MNLAATPSIELVQDFSDANAEYAAITTDAGLLDRPDRAVISATGADRLEFLNRMLTQELKDFTPLHSRRSFWLSRKGRVTTDMTLFELGEKMLVEVDALRAHETLNTLEEFIIVDEVQLEDISTSMHKLELIGPRALEFLGAVISISNGEFAPGRCAQGDIAGAQTLIEISDEANLSRIGIYTAPADALAVYQRLIEAGPRPVGLDSWNIVRTESSLPLFGVDFGPDSLPHETGLLDARVSFIKGCYLGQEVVARMQSLGKPKQVIVALHIEDPAAALPTPGTSVFSANDSSADAVGVITTSVLSPKLAGRPLALAQLRTKHAESGAPVFIQDADRYVAATISIIKLV